MIEFLEQPPRTYMYMYVSNIHVSYFFAYLIIISQWISLKMIIDFLLLSTHYLYVQRGSKNDTSINAPFISVLKPFDVNVECSVIAINVFHQSFVLFYCSIITAQNPQHTSVKSNICKYINGLASDMKEMRWL